MDPEARFRAWLRSVDRVFVPPRPQIMAAAREMGLTPGRTQQILDSEPELTRLKSGRVPKGRVAFRLRLWSQAEIDLGFLHLNNRSFGAFFLGIPRGPDSYAVWDLPPPPSAGIEPVPRRLRIRRRGGGSPRRPFPKKIITKKITKIKKTKT